MTPVFTVFNKAHWTGVALNTFRKYRKKVKINNSKITDQFQSNLATQKRSNVPETNVVSKPWEKL